MAVLGDQGRLTIIPPGQSGFDVIAMIVIDDNYLTYNLQRQQRICDCKGKGDVRQDVIPRTTTRAPLITRRSSHGSQEGQHRPALRS